MCQVCQGNQYEKTIDWIDIPENIRDQYQYTTCADMSKWAENGLSTPKWSLEDGIRDYISHLKEDGLYL